MESISQGWNGGQHEGPTSFVDKIVNCRRAISHWRKEQVPFGRDIIEDLKRQLEVAQADDAVGVKNTKYFQAQTKQRRARNRITGLYDKNNVWSTKDDDICSVAVSYFEDLFTSINPSNFQEALSEVKRVITEDVNDRLTTPAIVAEVRKALFLMSPDKAPGPDGMTALFFQKAWRVVKEDLVAMVNRFFEEGVFDKSLNRTHICLILKVAKPTRMAEMRPISLCNVGYKLISKIMCQQLKGVLPELVSETQSAFVPRRLISDNILIAQEMFHGLRTNPSCKGKFMAIKTDMSKAYDRVEWGFTEALLRKMGFGEIWISRIMFCVTSVEYKVLLNGQPNGRIVPERGLRQGDPLSPYLFILCTEVLVANIKRAEREKQITGIKFANKCPPITHLLFADDSLFFCKADKLGHKVDDAVRAEMQGVLGISNLGGMGSYLGLPESLGGSKTKLAWDKLCCSKQLGGLGFRNVDAFNTALLAKQLWRLIEAPDTLFARVFKGRYYRNSNPMDPIRSYSPSYGWRSITSARSFVNKGLIIRVSSGESISIWTDPWVPAQSPRPAFSKGPLKDPSLKISQLIDCHTNTWRMDRLKEFFAPEDVDLIGAIPLGSRRLDDSMGWHYTKSGKYTVKSGYEVDRRYAPQLTRVPRVGPEITPLLAAVWDVSCPPKIQHFMWQVLTGCISVSANLRRRGISCDPACVRCGAEEETINHAIFQCPPARQTCALAQVPVGPGSFPTESIYANVDHFLGSSNPGSQASVFLWLMWYIWKARNARVFENVLENPLDVIWLAEGEANVWLQAQVEVEDEDQPHAPLVPFSRQRGLTPFCPSSFTGYRCFVDGSWKATNALAGAGWFCSSTQDSRTDMGATNFRKSLSPLHAEVEALIWAMRCMIGHDYRDVVFYTDCSDLVKMVSSPHEWPAFTPYLDDIMIDQVEFSSFSLSLVSRTANVKADSLARQARLSPQHVLFVNSFPLNWLV
ncbi:PREDICTED: uncharacterized protein LOC104789549 [Camelina sativa]|uniref:Uncharacterized protein LOC104789549 n=1 Tax=Camelina sativa TaxID=90675 RepID=A0ABM0ZBZ6_CAMSA|nr:PREDICTED: uncharacterized protein LOC104789549 [Camelina sativa]